VPRRRRFAQLVTRDDVALPFDEQQEQPERLLLQPDARPAFAQFTRARVRLEHAEPKNARSLRHAWTEV